MNYGRIALLLPHLRLETVYRVYPYYEPIRRILDHRSYWLMIIERDLGFCPKFILEGRLPGPPSNESIVAPPPDVLRSLNPKLYYLRVRNYPLPSELWYTDRVEFIKTNIVAYDQGTALRSTGSVIYDGTLYESPGGRVLRLRVVHGLVLLIMYDGSVRRLKPVARDQRSVGGGSPWRRWQVLNFTCRRATYPVLDIGYHPAKFDIFYVLDRGGRVYRHTFQQLINDIEVIDTDTPLEYSPVTSYQGTIRVPQPMPRVIQLERWFMLGENGEAYSYHHDHYSGMQLELKASRALNLLPTKPMGGTSSRRSTERQIRAQLTDGSIRLLEFGALSYRTQLNWQRVIDPLYLDRGDARGHSDGHRPMKIIYSDPPIKLDGLLDDYIGCYREAWR